MKRYLSFLLCMAILLCLLPTMPAVADDPQIISGVRLTLPGELFDGSGKLLPGGRVADVTPVSATQGVLAEPVKWYCGGIPLDIPDSALQPFARYRVFVRLQAEEGCFTPDTKVEILDTVQPVQGISPDRKTAYVLSPGVMTACDHSGAELRCDISGHWMECPLCYHSFDLSDHLWDNGAEIGEEILYTCTACAETKTEAAGKKLLNKAALLAAPAVLQESIPEPTLENDDQFRIVRYQWFKDGTREEHKVNVGDTFTEGSYYLSITVRVKNAGQDYINANSYISTAGAWNETSCTVDADAGAITSVFSVPVYSSTTANITLPSVNAGADIADTLKDCKITSPKFSPSLTSVMVYENGEYMGLYAETSLGFSTWVGEDAAFQPGKVYTLIGTAAFDGWYTDSFYIFVENPGVCADLDIEGGAESLGFRATYLCPDEPAITSIAISGVKNPIAETAPTAITLDCEEPAFYDAKLSAWYDNEEEVTIFEEGRTYQAIIAVTPKQGILGLNQDSAPLLPVLVNGQLAAYAGAGENGSFLYRAAFLCDPNPNPHTHTYEDVITFPTCTADGYTTHICKCGDSYRDSETSALGHNWDEGKTTVPPTEHEVGEETYTCTRCGEIQTKELPKLEHEHTYQRVVTDPTCEAGGFTTYTCNCGASYQDSATEALGHHYSEGLCTRCGNEDPNAPCTGGETCPGHSFTDMPAAANWAHAGIDYCVENGLMNGIGSNRFDPAGTCSRAMIVSILYRLEGSPAVTYSEVFADVPDNSWYTDGVLWAEEHDIVNGFGNGKFGPGDQITREQLSTILMRYAQYRGISTQARADLSRFPDGGKVNTWAATAAQWAVAEGMISGKGVNGTVYLQPQGSATRAESATILMRFCKTFDL